MLIVHSEAHRQHAPRHFLVRGTLHQNAEVPERADRLLAAVRGAIAKIDANLQVVATGSPFAQADRLAQRFGLKVCGAEASQ